MPGILLLNASYEPLTILTHKRASSLLLRERVEAVGSEAIEIRGDPILWLIAGLPHRETSY